MSHKILFEMKCLELGILPEHILQKETDAFEGISAEDRRKMCRKFRKLRRNLQKRTKRKIRAWDVFHQIKMKLWEELTE